jgi:hypothetical protein
MDKISMKHLNELKTEKMIKFACYYFMLISIIFQLLFENQIANSDWRVSINDLLKVYSKSI